MCKCRGWQLVYVWPLSATETSPIDCNFGRPTNLIFNITADRECQYTSLNINSLTISLLNTCYFYFKSTKVHDNTYSLCYKPAFSCLSFINHFNIFRNSELSVLLALKRYCTSYPKISMFCALSQNHQHLLEK